VELSAQDAAAATGKATQVIYTEYDFRSEQGSLTTSSSIERPGVVRQFRPTDPREARSGTGASPSTGAVLKPAAPTGILGVRFRQDENPWLGNQFQGGIAAFDRERKRSGSGACPRS